MNLPVATSSRRLFALKRARVLAASLVCAGMAAVSGSLRFAGFPNRTSIVLIGIQCDRFQPWTAIAGRTKKPASRSYRDVTGSGPLGDDRPMYRKRRPQFQLQ